MPADSMVVAHEDRIQRVEDALMSSSKVLAEHGVILDNIQHSVEETKATIETKIQEGFETVKDQLKETNEQVKRVIGTVGAHDERILKLETSENTRKHRTKKLKKIGMWGLAGVGGIVFKEIFWGLILHFVK